MTFMEGLADLILDPPALIIIIGGLFFWCSAWILLALSALAGSFWTACKTFALYRATRAWYRGIPTVRTSVRHHSGWAPVIPEENPMEETPAPDNQAETESTENTAPGGRDCPACDCCKEPLCMEGKTSPSGCASYVNEACRQNGPCMDAVRNCPCSSESAPDTVAHQVAQVIAAWHAAERPLGEAAEKTLRAVAEGKPAQDMNTRVLYAWRYIAEDEGGFSLTDAGRAYLEARDSTP